MQAMEMNKNRKYTYADYLTWPEGERWEIIDGEAYPTYGPTALSAPTLGHQDLAGEIFFLLKSYLRDKTCKVFISPVDVVFEADERTENVVQPDVVVVCDPEKVKDGKKVVGAPDIAVEILSPSTSVKDWTKKMRLYEREGVREYWIVSPGDKVIYQSILKEGAYETIAWEEGEMQSEALEDFSLNIAELFSV